MALRMLEMVCADERRSEVEELLAEHEPLGLWHDRLMDQKVMVRILLPAEKAEAVLDLLESRFSWMEGFYVIVTAVETAVPLPKAERPPPAEPGAEAPPSQPERISRHEVYACMAASAGIGKVFVAMVIVSSLVAAIGMLRDNVAVIIGAMVIAPLLGPSMALAFATTLSDGELGRKALRTSAAGIAMAFFLAVLLATIFQFDTSVSAEMGLRAQAELSDVVLALAAGAVGALAFTTGIHTPLVGVMVAVALLPPLVASGLFLGAGEPKHAFGAALLFATNLICINLAGVATFLVQGIRPRTWWEADKARKASRRALALWIGLLVVLVVLIVLSHR